jgi:hypothetical protein
MDYIEILFLLAAITIIIIFVVFYVYISKQINNIDGDMRVNQIKLTMATLDK